MKQVILTEEEARTLVRILRYNWVPFDDQKTVYEMVRRIEKELEG